MAQRGGLLAGRMWAQGGFLGFACGHGFGGGALLQLRTATKKAGGSSANGRDSLPKHLGLKLSDGQQAKVGAMIYKQRGTRLMPGFGVRAGRDGSLHAELPGVVRYETDKRTGRQSVSIQISDDIREAITKRSAADPKPLFHATGLVGFKSSAKSNATPA